VVLVSLLLTLPLVASTASAEVLYSFGQTQLGAAPLTTGFIDPPWAFSEGEQEGPVRLDMNVSGVYRLGDGVGNGEDRCRVRLDQTMVASDYVIQRPPAGSTNEDVLIFSGRILGVSHGDECREMTQGIFADPDFVYPRDGGLGFRMDEADVLETFDSGRAIYHRLTAARDGDEDGYRVFTEAPALDAISDLQLGCLPERQYVTPGTRVDYTFTLHNPSDTVDAPDPQIVFRPPPSVVVTTSGDFDCVPDDRDQFFFCELRSPPLGAGESADLTIGLTYPSTFAASARLQVFGSGHVRDFDLSNNACELEILSGDPVVDAGTDGSLDGGTLGDTGSEPPPGPLLPDGGGPQGSFRGAGGCTCDATASGDGMPLHMAGLALYIGIWLRRRRR